MLSMGTGVASIVVTVSAEKAAVAQRTASASEEIKLSPSDLISVPVRFLSRSSIVDHTIRKQKKR